MLIAIFNQLEISVSTPIYKAKIFNFSVSYFLGSQLYFKTTEQRSPNSVV